MNYQQNIQKLEQLYNRKPEIQSNRSAGEFWLKKIWQRAIAALDRNSDIRVWKTETAGRSLWKLYDPATGETFDFDSENEVRTWIEESYRRSPMPERCFRPFCN